ncbi:cell wall-binding repeat-containing protein [Clostridioides sp. GD02377]|uniref:cell wall-binding repeat-containing protein n=1 Tax=unclassified Clostridioides TaxID=2635829 RepID=UPI0038A689EA
MKVNKKIIALVVLSSILASLSIKTSNALTKETLIGSGRWDTAIKISQNGWSNSNEAILVNDNSIADALSATPFAKLKNAPVLLTQSNNLDERTKTELKRLGVKKIYLIGGEHTLNKSIENNLKSIGISSERIFGNSRYETSLKLAQKMKTMANISEIAVVNGTKGLADAVSVGAAAAQNNIPIILSDTNNGINVSKDFINSIKIDKSYIIGGLNSVSSSVENGLPSPQRLSGENRNQTNAKVIEQFYKDVDLRNAYITKDGMKKEGDLIDSLAVGVLAAKNSSPVILVGNKLDSVQISVLNTKCFDKITQVGGLGNENAFNEIKNIQEETKYTVETIDELKVTLGKVDANDTIMFKPEDKINGLIDIDTKKTIKITFDGIFGGKITLNMPNSDVNNKGTIEKEVEIKDLKKETLTNEGYINDITVYDNNGLKIDNRIDGEINRLTFINDAEDVLVDNSGKIYRITNNAKNVTIKNSGRIDILDGSRYPAMSGKSPEEDNVIEDDDDKADGISVSVYPCTPPKKDSVMLKVSTKPKSSSYEMYYRIVNSRPSAMNVGSSISKSSWKKVSNQNSFTINVQDGKYIEVVETKTTDSKVNRWGRSGVTNDNISDSTTSRSTIRFYYK